MRYRLVVNYPPGDVWSLTPFLRDFASQRPGDTLKVECPCPELLAGAPWYHGRERGETFDRTLYFKFTPSDKTDGVTRYGMDGKSSMRLEWYTFWERETGIRVEPRATAPDFFPTDREKAYSLVPTGRPVCILNAGWKADIPVKFWGSDRFSSVVEALKDRVLFVQVGASRRGMDHHDRIPGALDMVGRTTLRELACLVYHADIVLTGISQLHHAAGMPCYKPRTCITVAGAREPENWANCYKRRRVKWHWLSAPSCKGGEPGCWGSVCRPDCPAIRSIGPDRVIDIIKEIIQ